MQGHPAIGVISDTRLSWQREATGDCGSLAMWLICILCWETRSWGESDQGDQGWLSLQPYTASQPFIQVDSLDCVYCATAAQRVHRPRLLPGYVVKFCLDRISFGFAEAAGPHQLLTVLARRRRLSLCPFYASSRLVPPPRLPTIQTREQKHS